MFAETGGAWIKLSGGFLREQKKGKTLEGMLNVQASLIQQNRGKKNAVVDG